MVDAHDVADLERGAQAVAPPGVAVGAVCRPIVERVAPQLAVGGEIIRRHAGHGDGQEGFGVELEEMRRGPGVGGVGRHENREVADDAHAALLRGGAELRPLAEEQILAEAVGVGRFGELRAQRRFSCPTVVARFGGPFPPRRAVEMILQGAEERVIVEPARLARAERCVVAVRQRGLLLPEQTGGDLQQAGLQPAERFEVHRIGRERRERHEVAGGQQAVAHERHEIHEVGVAGEGGVTLVGRVAETGRAERAHLPVFDAGGGEEIEEAHGVLVEHAATLGARQCGRMQQHAGGAIT